MAKSASPHLFAVSVTVERPDDHMEGMKKTSLEAVARVFAEAGAAAPAGCAAKVTLRSSSRRGGRCNALEESVVLLMVAGLS
jgi:hypothetical protein